MKKWKKLQNDCLLLQQRITHKTRLKRWMKLPKVNREMRDHKTLSKRWMKLPKVNT